MKERQRLIVTALVVLMLIFWLGFFLHRSPRFAGSLMGGVLGVSGAVLMLAPLAYLLVKRVKRLNRWVTRLVSMRTLLTWHIYAGVLGPILVILHSGHKFDSTLGIVLTAMTLIVVLSGFTGRYLLAQISETLNEKKEILAQLQIGYRRVVAELIAVPAQAEMLRPFFGVFARWITIPFMRHAGADRASSPMRGLTLAESIADVEYAIKMHVWFKSVFRWWIKFHITIALILYVLLALHVWSAIHFGIRWFS
ncbi:hypothetical protein ACYZT7_21100 [Pseudomonas sp. RT4P38]